MLNFAAREPNKVYLERLVIMAMLLVLSVCMQGLRALTVGVASVLFCVLADVICCLIRKCATTQGIWLCRSGGWRRRL